MLKPKIQSKREKGAHKACAILFVIFDCLTTQYAQGQREGRGVPHHYQEYRHRSLDSRPGLPSPRSWWMRKDARGSVLTVHSRDSSDIGGQAKISSAIICFIYISMRSDTM